MQGIKEKLGDAISKDKLDMWVSTLSELRITTAFAELGFQVQLIPDRPLCGEWFETPSPPDLSLTDGNFKALVEVTRWAPDGTGAHIYKLLTPILEENDLTLRFSLSPDLSTLVVGHKERSDREEAVETFAQAVFDFIKNLDRNTLPVCETIHGVDLEIECAEAGLGRIKSWNTDASTVPEDGDSGYKRQLFDRLVKKAAKPCKWSPVQQKLPYFIAIEIEQNVGQNTVLPRVLYGGKTLDIFMKPNERQSPAVDYSPIVEERLKTSEWREFLLMLGYDSTQRCYIDRLGFLASDQNATRVCGIIVLHGGSLAYYPNPFVDTTLLRSDYDQLLKVPFAASISAKTF